jgi:hypothetical protein
LPLRKLTFSPEAIFLTYLNLRLEGSCWNSYRLPCPLETSPSISGNQVVLFSYFHVYPLVNNSPTRTSYRGIPEGRQPKSTSAIRGTQSFNPGRQTAGKLAGVVNGGAIDIAGASRTIQACRRSTHRSLLRKCGNAVNIRSQARTTLVLHSSATVPQIQR